MKGELSSVDSSMLTQLAEHDQLVLDIRGNCAAMAHLLGSHVTAVFNIEPAEQARRSAASADAALLRMDVLDALLAVPFGVPRSTSALPVRVKNRLRRASAASVSWQADTVTRLAAPPLTPDLVILAARRWRSGNLRAAAFATYCRRLVVLDGDQGDVRAHAAEADFYGTGLAVRVGNTVELVVAPAEANGLELNAATWLFAETIWELWCPTRPLMPRQ